MLKSKKNVGRTYHSCFPKFGRDPGRMRIMQRKGGLRESHEESVLGAYVEVSSHLVDVVREQILYIMQHFAEDHKAMRCLF